MRTFTVFAVLALVATGVCHAGEGEWTLQLESMFVGVYGHDRPVLTIHEVDTDPPTLDRKTGVDLETTNGNAFRGEFQYDRGDWSWGIDVFWFLTTMEAPAQTAAAEGPAGTLDEVLFEVSDRSFSSSDPNEVLYYQQLEDTDYQNWIVDAYAMRSLAETEKTSLDLQFGLRVGDFDNDYHALTGVEGVGGVLIDASSNYGLLLGPIMGLSGEIRQGRHTFEGYVGQSLLIGEVELSNTFSDFTGPADTPSFVAVETLSKNQDVAIPVTEFRISWTCRVHKNVALGLSANSSTWRNMPVPPGIEVGVDQSDTFYENTITMFGVSGALVLNF